MPVEDPVFIGIYTGVKNVYEASNNNDAMRRKQHFFAAFKGLTKGASSMNKEPAVYILASKRNGTLYIGVTSDLIKRVWEHKNNMVEGFTKRYGVHQLVWYEIHDNMESAMEREKRLKNWKRAWKLKLIEGVNPDWEDLYHRIV
jgi:putative endonuclease